MKRIKALIKKGFESSSGKTPEFLSFARKFKNDITKELVAGATLVNFNVGHFYVSGFIKLANGKFYYFSISDVRFFPNGKLLIRSAKNEKDYTGGTNNYVDLEDGELKLWLKRIEARDSDYL